MYILVDKDGNVWTQKVVSENDIDDSNEGYFTILHITSMAQILKHENNKTWEILKCT